MPACGVVVRCLLLVLATLALPSPRAAVAQPKLDAAVELANGTAVFFKGDRVVVYNLSREQVDGPPRPLCEVFGGLPDSWCRQGIDAAMLGHGGGRIHIFKRGEFLRWNLRTGAPEGPPRPIAEGWRGIFPDGVDTAVNAGNGKAWFFKGSRYARFDFLADQIDSGYPKDIAGNWTGFPTSWYGGIDAAFCRLNGKVFFFRGTDYIRFDVRGDKSEPGYPQKISDSTWGGLLPFLSYLPPAPPPPASPPSPVAAAAPTLEFLDAAGRATRSIDPGLWDGAFADDATLCDSPGAGRAKPLNMAAEAQNFVGSDSRRFYIQVRDPAAAGKGRLTLRWWTEVPRRGVLDQPADASVQMVETSPGLFRSPALLVVTDPWELANVPTTDGNGGAALLRRGAPGYRLRAANLASDVIAEYRPSSGIPMRRSAAVFARTPEARRILPVQFYFFHDAAHPPPTSDWVRAELRFIRSVYARVGVHVTTATPALPGGFTVLNVDGDKVHLIATWPNMDVNTGLTAAQWALVSASYPSLDPAGATLRVFFVGRLADHSCGKGADPNGCHAPAIAPDAVWVADRWRAAGTTSAAHEIGHALGLPHVIKDLKATPPINENPSPGSRFAPLNNLMADPPKESKVFFGTACFPGRLWDVTLVSKGKTYNQYQTVRGARYIRPWPSSAAQPANLFPASVP